MLLAGAAVLLAALGAARLSSSLGLPSLLLFLFLGEMLTASAMGHYEEEIAKAVVLALFVPLIISSGGNSGSQATSLIIRALALQVVLKVERQILRRRLGLLAHVVIDAPRHHDPPRERADDHHQKEQPRQEAGEFGADVHGRLTPQCSRN